MDPRIGNWINHHHERGYRETCWQPVAEPHVAGVCGGTRESPARARSSIRNGGIHRAEQPQAHGADRSGYDKESQLSISGRTGVVGRLVRLVGRGRGAAPRYAVMVRATSAGVGPDGACRVARRAILVRYPESLYEPAV